MCSAVLSTHADSAADKQAELAADSLDAQGDFLDGGVQYLSQSARRGEGELSMADDSVIEANSVLV
jgi:hypothetical protein